MEEETDEQRRKRELDIWIEKVRLLTCEEYSADPWSAEGDASLDDSSSEPDVWLDGVPEWLMSDYGVKGRNGINDTHVFRTVFTWGVPKLAPDGWEQVGVYSHSGETECLCERDAEAVDDDEDGKCPLCEGDGIIYIGDGYCEIVYRAPNGLFWPDDYCSLCGHELHECYMGSKDFKACFDRTCLEKRIKAYFESGPPNEPSWSVAIVDIVLGEKDDR